MATAAFPNFIPDIPDSDCIITEIILILISGPTGGCVLRVRPVDRRVTGHRLQLAEVINFP